MVAPDKSCAQLEGLVESVKSLASPRAGTLRAPTTSAKNKALTRVAAA